MSTIKSIEQTSKSRSGKPGTSIFSKILITFLALTILMVLFSNLLIAAAYEEIISRYTAQGTQLDSLAAKAIIDQNLFLTEQNVKIQIALIVILTIILTAFVTIIISGSLTRPIKELVQGTKEIAAGNLNFKLNIEASREIEELADSFNQMGQDLKSGLTNLELERDRTKAIIQYLTDGLVVIDRQDQVSLLNPKAKEMLGFTKENWQIAIEPTLLKNKHVRWRNLAKIVYGERKAGSRADQAQAIRTYEVNLGKHRELTLNVTSTPFYDESGKESGSLRILHDVSKEKMIDKMKSEFITIAAHQLRTPLTAVKWGVKLLIDGTSKSVKMDEDLLNKVYISNERMIRLVNDLLNVSVIEAGKTRYVFALGRFREVIKTIDNNFKKPFKERGLKFIKALPPELPILRMDRDKIIFVLENILDNAVKYTPRNGQIKLTVKVQSHDLMVAVEDNGVGIPENSQERLYTKFFRAENVMRMQTEGSGLGLFIVKKIINAHQGKINITSQEGKGTKVEFTLPIKS